MNIITELVALIKPMLSKKDVAKVQTDIQSMGKGMESAFASWGKAVSHMITRVLGPLALLHKAFQFGESIMYAALLGNELSNMSNIVNVGVENLQGLTAAAANVNVSTLQVEIGLRRLSFVMNKAVEGTKGFADILPGRWWEDGNGKVLTATDMFMKLSDIMNKMPNDIHKTAKMHVLLGRTGERLEPLMNKGSAAIRAYIDTMKEYGLAIDENGVKKSVELNSKLQDLSLRWEGFKQTIVQSGFIELLGYALTRVGWAVLGMTRALQGNSNGWDAAALAANTFFTAASIGATILAFKMQALSVAGLKAAAPWLAFAAAAILAGLAFEDLWVSMKGGDSLGNRFARFLNRFPAFQASLALLIAPFNLLIDLASAFVDLLTGNFTTGSWQKIAEDIKGIFKGLFDSLNVFGIFDSMASAANKGTYKGPNAGKKSNAILPTAEQLNRAGMAAVSSQASIPAPAGAQNMSVAAPMTANIVINPSAGMDEKAVGEQVRKELETYDQNQRQSTYSGLHSGGAF